MTIESMPNFCMLYGPNTNLGHNRYDLRFPKSEIPH